MRLSANPEFQVEDLADGERRVVNIGAGRYAIKQHGWLNCDLYPGNNIDLVFDATKRWPFADNSVHDIIAIHVLEHLNDFESFFMEAWRVLDPKTGRLHLALPYVACDAGVGDPSHVQQWNAIRFCFLQPGYGEASHNPQHDWKYPFKIELCMERINPNLGWLCRWPLWNIFGNHLINYLWNGITEMKVQLKPLKTPEDLAVFHTTGQGNVVPTAHFAYEHEIAGRKLNPGEVMKARFLTWYVRGFTDQFGFTEKKES